MHRGQDSFRSIEIEANVTGQGGGAGEFLGYSNFLLWKLPRNDFTTKSRGRYHIFWLT